MAWLPFAVLAAVRGNANPQLASAVGWGGRWLLLSGIAVGMTLEAIAIPLLLGAFSRRKWARGVFSALSLCCAVFMSLLFMVLLVVVWLGIQQFQPRG